ALLLARVVLGIYGIALVVYGLNCLLTQQAVSPGRNNGWLLRSRPQSYVTGVDAIALGIGNVAIGGVFQVLGHIVGGSVAPLWVFFDRFHEDGLQFTGNTGVQDTQPGRLLAADLLHQAQAQMSREAADETQPCIGRNRDRARGGRFTSGGRLIGFRSANA